MTNPYEVTLQDGERAVEAYPPHADYQEATERRIPVFVATKKGDPAT